MGISHRRGIVWTFSVQAVGSTISPRMIENLLTVDAIPHSAKS